LYFILGLEVRSASRPRLLAVAFGHRALLWPIFEKGMFFFFLAEDDIFGVFFFTFPGQFSKL
jgi:hypothetical protein